MITLLSIVGALAVLSFVAFVVLGLTRGWQDETARWVLRIAGGFAILCAVLGVLVAVVGG